MVAYVLMIGMVNVRDAMRMQAAAEMILETSSTVMVLRNQSWYRVASMDIVPGDLVCIEPTLKAHCRSRLSGAPETAEAPSVKHTSSELAFDAAVVFGSVLVEEKVSGKTQKLIKVALTESDLTLAAHAHASESMLFQGSVVLKPEDEFAPPVLAVVMSTGIDTRIGWQVWSSLYQVLGSSQVGAFLPLSISLRTIYIPWCDIWVWASALQPHTHTLTHSLSLVIVVMM